jgi:curli biogenesis system outer membrane secretion channel CsgG
MARLRLRANTTAAALLAAAFLAGCGGGWGADPDAIKPTVAVMRFDNRTSTALGWNLSDGLADMLVDSLVATGRYQVVDRTDIDSVLREIQFQQTGVTRPHGRAKVGRLKNVQFLVKGTVTDFDHVSKDRGVLDALGWDVITGSHRAVMGVLLQVVDVESGQVVASEAISESVRADDVSVQAEYKGIAFGGRTFQKTPLGKATGKVIERAVGEIGKSISARPWVPKVAQVTGSGRVVINGGRNRGVCPGSEYDVMGPSSPVIDPDSGDLLGHRPGERAGRVRVVEVYPRYSVAEVTFGEEADLGVGQHCVLAVAPPE